VLSPQALKFESGVLHDGRDAIELVYNRLTDFALAAHLPLREAYLSNAAVVTPHPRAHALYADKRNLSLLGDAARLQAWGVDAVTTETLRRHIPCTSIVTQSNADALWAARRGLFFKPAAGHGSRAAYRGEKLTRRVWDEIRAGNYVAQALVAPGERRLGPQAVMKVDVRNYVYDGCVQLLAARLYQGQATNMRTKGGGFAPVLTTALESVLPIAA